MAVVLAFLASTLGRYLLIGVAVIGIIFGIHRTGYNSAKRVCEAAAKQREIEIMNKDIQIGQMMAKEDDRNATELAKDQEKENEFQRKLEAELSKRPAADRCALTEPDRLRLR
jgi:hypothetical protein